MKRWPFFAKNPCFSFPCFGKNPCVLLQKFGLFLSLPITPLYPSTRRAKSIPSPRAILRGITIFDAFSPPPLWKKVGAHVCLQQQGLKTLQADVVNKHVVVVVGAFIVPLSMPGEIRIVFLEHTFLRSWHDVCSTQKTFYRIIFDARKCS